MHTSSDTRERKREIGGRGEKKRQTNVRATLRRQWGSKVPARSCDAAGSSRRLSGTLLYADTLCPRLRATPERSQLHRGDRSESFSDRKTTERRARFNLRSLRVAAARRGAFPFARCIVASSPSSAARFNNHDNDDELSHKPDRRRLAATNLIGDGK